MKTYTEDELKYKAEVYCSASEHCPSEVEAKLKQWGADEDMVEHIMEHLQKERYVDTLRFCCAFVRDKYRFAHWGRMRIVKELRMKRLPAEDISKGLEEIDEKEYAEGLQDLLDRKGRTVSGRNEYERKAKLIRFAVGKGFTPDEVMRYVKTDEFE